MKTINIIGHIHEQKTFELNNETYYTVGNAKNKGFLNYIGIDEDGNIYQKNWINEKPIQKFAVCIISDIHIQAGRCNDCKHTDQELFDFIFNVYENCDCLIFLGDIYDLRQPLFPFLNRWEYKRACKQYPKTSEFIKNNGFKIFGNHDFEMKRIADYKEKTEIGFSNGIKIKLMHGHQLEKTGKFYMILSNIGLFFVGLIERIFPKIDEEGEKILSDIGVNL